MVRVSQVTVFFNHTLGIPKMEMFNGEQHDKHTSIFLTVGYPCTVWTSLTSWTFNHPCNHPCINQKIYGLLLLLLLSIFVFFFFGRLESDGEGSQRPLVTNPSHFPHAFRSYGVICMYLQFYTHIYNTRSCL